MSHPTKVSADVALPEQMRAWVLGDPGQLDLTRRDIQDEAKELSRPWDWAKGFDASAPCSPVFSVEVVGHPVKGGIWLKVNGEVKQRGDLRELIWSIPEVISTISRAVDLALAISSTAELPPG
ncbi:MAG: fumarylpyruvate hydrolase [Mycobacterium sp.]|nr:fumarylpyruvate hydrolase [Mycobacterium sp.]